LTFADKAYPLELIKFLANNVANLGSISPTVYEQLLREQNPKAQKESLYQAWATSGPRATCGPPSTLMWPANIYDKTLKMPLKMLLFRKLIDKSPFSLKSQIKKVHILLILARIINFVSNVAREPKRVAHPWSI
jgi:hypothetical protein